MAVRRHGCEEAWLWEGRVLACDFVRCSLMF